MVSVIEAYCGIGLGDTENITLRLLQQNRCDYCHNISLEYLLYNRAQHHCTCVPLETTTASLSIGMNLWVSMVVVGTNLISTLYYSIVMHNVWQYSAIYCTCNIIEM